MRIMQIVWRTDRDILDWLTLAPELIDMAVEALKFDEKIRIRKITVHDSDRICRIEGYFQVTPNSFNCLKMTRRNVTCGTNQSERGHRIIHQVALDSDTLPHFG